MYQLLELLVTLGHFAYSRNQRLRDVATFAYAFDFEGKVTALGILWSFRADRSHQDVQVIEDLLFETLLFLF